MEAAGSSIETDVHDRHRRGYDAPTSRVVRAADPSPSTEVAAHKETDKLTISGFRQSDVADQIDLFYRDSSNLRIPVVDAYKYAMKKMHGAKSQELDNYSAELRLT